MATSEEAGELACPVCLSGCQAPVSLSCSHNFCRLCITEVLNYQRAEGRAYTCPICQLQYQEFPALQPTSTAEKCQTKTMQTSQSTEDCAIPCSYCLGHPNEAVKTCLNCEVSLCKQHLEKHSNKGHTLLEPTGNLEERKCSEHDKLLEYYCEEDDSCVCVTCYIAGVHKGHNIMTLKQAHEKQLAALSATTSALSTNVEALSKDIEDLNAGLAMVKENTAKLTKPLENLCERIIKLVKEEFDEIAKAITSKQEQTTSEITAIIKKMEDAKATTEQALKDLDAASKQQDDLLFLKDSIRSQTLIKQENPKIDSMQVVDVEADQKMIRNIDEETTDYIASVRNVLKYMHTVLFQQTQQLVWSGTQREKMEQTKPDFLARYKNSEKINLSFNGLYYTHCSYTVTVSDRQKTLTATQSATFCQPLSRFGFSNTSTKNFTEFEIFTTSTQNTAPYVGTGFTFASVKSQSNCNCKLPIVIPCSIAKNTFSSKVCCLVDVSMSNDWCVGVTNRGSNSRYLRWNGNRLSYEWNTSLYIGNQKINTLKMQLDFDANSLGFYDAGSETEMLILICKCDDLFTSPIDVGFNITNGSLTLA